MAIRSTSLGRRGARVLRTLGTARILAAELALVAIVAWPQHAMALGAPWVRYSAIFFTADFPSQPKDLGYLPSSGASDPFKGVTTYTAASQSGHAEYSVRYYAIKDETKARLTNGEIMTMVIGWSVDLLKCKPSVEMVVSENVPGIEALFEHCDYNVWGKTRYFVIRERLTVISVDSKGPEPIADVDRFLNSLHMWP